MSQWQNPPHHGFSVDPSVAPTLRPSTSDRGYADATLRLAHAEGRLSDDELAERVERAGSAWSLRELSDVIADVSVPAGPGANLTNLPVAAMPPIMGRVDPARRNAALVLKRSVVGWLALAVMFNVIWFFTTGVSSTFHGYYWPFWPILGTAVPLIGLVVARFGPDPRPLPRPEPPRDLR